MAQFALGLWGIPERIGSQGNQDSSLKDRIVNESM